MHNILETKDLRKYYGTGVNQVRALDGVSLSVRQREFVAVVGTSGSGKSTLLHMLGGLDRPTAGKVFVDGKDIFSLKDDALYIFRRRKIGFVFQSYNLVPVLNIEENITLPIELDGCRIDRDFIREIVEMLGLEQKLNTLPGELSGGQQQRVAIARALATKPAIILADEPTGNLDSATSQDVLSLLKVTGSQFGQTIVMITHNEEISQTADRIIRIEDGRIAGAGYKGDEVTIEFSDTISKKYTVLAVAQMPTALSSQQRRMLQWEGLYYALLSLLISCTVGVGAGYALVRAFTGQMDVFIWRFTLLPVAICTPFLIAISLAVPAVCYANDRKQSVVERLRVAE